MDRKIGVEIEFYGVDVLGTSTLLSDLFGGSVNQENQSKATVENTQFGDIKVELDARLSQQISEYANKDEGNKFLKSLDQASSKLLQRASVPVDIVFPPVREEHLNDLDKILPRLLDFGALGTQEKFYFAFGVHLNVSTNETDVLYYRDMLLSFFLIQSWLAKKNETRFL